LRISLHESSRFHHAPSKGVFMTDVFAHDLVRKPVPTFRDHALCPS
jgi:hypothetical protein